MTKEPLADSSYSHEAGGAEKYTKGVNNSGKREAGSNGQRGLVTHEYDRVSSWEFLGGHVIRVGEGV